MEHIIAVLIGWFLGLSSNLILSWFYMINEILDFIDGIICELDNVLVHLVNYKLSIDKLTGSFGLPSLFWTIDIYNNIPRGLINESNLDEIGRLLDLDEGIEVFNNNVNVSKNILFNIKIPYIVNNMSKIAKLSSQAQLIFFRIIDGIQFLNDKITKYAPDQKRSGQSLTNSQIIFLNSISKECEELSWLIINFKTIINNFLPKKFINNLKCFLC